MALSRRTTLMLSGSIVAAAAIVAGLMVGFSNSEAGAPVAAAPVVKTDFPGLPAPTGDPQLASLAAMTPQPGTVELAEGPFDDRFQVTGLVFDGTTVSGSILVTSDVSEVINLEVLAGFYDSSGAMVGEGRFVLEHVDSHEASGPPNESTPFQIAVPAELVGQAVSAAIAVPVLVNE